MGIKKNYMSNRVTKNELIKEVASRAGFTMKDTKELLDATVFVIKQHLYNYEEVSWSGFGYFTLKVIGAHMCKAIRPGEPDFEVEARRYPQFKPSNKFKSEINADTFEVEDKSAVE